LLNSLKPPAETTAMYLTAAWFTAFHFIIVWPGAIFCYNRRGLREINKTFFFTKQDYFTSKNRLLS
jgi:hypothetical protein